MKTPWMLRQSNGSVVVRCRHPRPLRQRIDQLHLLWPDGQSLALERASGQRQQAWSGPSPQPLPAGWQLLARLDLQPELNALQRLTPGPGQLQGWLLQQQQRRRWRGLVLAAGSNDDALTLEPALQQRLQQLLIRHALLDPHEHPGLEVLLALTPQGRRLAGWLQCLQGAGPRQLPLLQLPTLRALGRQERLLALTLLCQQAGSSNGAHSVAGWAEHRDATAGATLLQYWEGDPVPSDVEAMLAAWRQRLPELRMLRLNAASARQWIAEHGDSGDGARFQRCWHPAMQSDFLRVLSVTRQGGVYLDCDTPTPPDPAALERWRQLVLQCWSQRSLALCVNAVRRPGDIRHYVVNCCLWAPPQHPLMQRWLMAYRQRLDALPPELVGTPRGIHRLGPELVSELIDDLIQNPSCRLEAIHWQGVTLPRLVLDDWSVLLLDPAAYQDLFGVPFSCHASYQSCNDPRDWKVGAQL